MLIISPTHPPLGGLLFPSLYFEHPSSFMFEPGKRPDTHFAAIIGEPVEMQIDLEQGSGRQRARPLGLNAPDDKWRQI
jgi:hypothetical protein